jgi:hypothetical protein
MLTLQAHHDAVVTRCDEQQAATAKWDSAEFDGVADKAGDDYSLQINGNNHVAEDNGLEATAAAAAAAAATAAATGSDKERINAFQGKDKLALQNYGAPYKGEGDAARPTGVFYSFAKQTVLPSDTV